MLPAALQARLQGGGGSARMWEWPGQEAALAVAYISIGPEAGFGGK